MKRSFRSNTRRNVHGFAKLVTGATFILLVAGGLVTSTESGLSVPDWPLSYGQFFPPMIGGIRFEHTHRVIAACVGILTLLLSVYLFIKERRRWLKFAGVAALAMVVAQAVLGGLTVIYLLPPAVSIFHACLGQSFFCFMSCLSLFTSKGWIKPLFVETEESGPLKRLSILTTGLAYLQLVAGAFVRHTDGGAVGFHITLAFFVLFHVLFLVQKVVRNQKLHDQFLAHILALGLLTVTQIFLGFGAFITTRMLPAAEMPRTVEVLFATAHQATGALLLMTCAILTLRFFRLFRPLEAGINTFQAAVRAQ